MKRIGAAAVLLAGVAAGAEAAEISWDEKFYNPKPEANDLVLPMPCGGAMTFRPIAVAVENIVGDSKVRIGTQDPTYGYSEGSRTVYISAPFTDAGDGNRRVYYLAKYELTADQAAALRGACPDKVAMKGRLPALGIGWIDAVGLADGYSRWLLENAPSALPSEDGMTGHIRLPTEAEWEFAARGGLKVSPSEFVEPLYPMPEGLNGHAWFGSSGSANGKPRPTGLKAANPLGLHDVLGNAEEVVLDGFRLVHLDRMQGMTGGYMVKGGSFLTEEPSMRASYRQEVPYYDAAGARTLPTAGVRLAIGAPILTSADRLRDIEDAWRALPRETEPTGPDLGEVQDDPLAELDALSDAVGNDEIQKRLRDVSAEFKVSLEALNEQRDLAARSLLQQGGIYEQSLAGDAAVIKKAQSSIELLTTAGASSATLKRALQAQENRHAAFQANLRAYADLIVEVSSAFDLTLLVQQQKVQATALREKGLDTMVAHVVQFLREVRRYSEQGRVSIEDLSARFEGE